MEASDMKKSTIECCSTLLVLHLPTFLTNPNTDDYVVRNLMDNFIKILSLHCEKPKFRALLFDNTSDNNNTTNNNNNSDDISLLSNWLRDVALPKLAALCSLYGISETNRIHYLRAFAALAKVDNELKKLVLEQQQQQQQGNTNRKSLKCEKHLATLLSIATDVHHSQLYRAAAFDVLRLLNPE